MLQLGIKGGNNSGNTDLTSNISLRACRCNGREWTQCFAGNYYDTDHAIYLWFHFHFPLPLFFAILRCCSSLITAPVNPAKLSVSFTSLQGELTPILLSHMLVVFLFHTHFIEDHMYFGFILSDNNVCRETCIRRFGCRFELFHLYSTSPARVGNLESPLEVLRCLKPSSPTGLPCLSPFSSSAVFDCTQGQNVKLAQYI